MVPLQFVVDKRECEARASEFREREKQASFARRKDCAANQALRCQAFSTCRRKDNLKTGINSSNLLIFIRCTVTRSRGEENQQPFERSLILVYLTN